MNVKQMNDSEHTVWIKLDKMVNGERCYLGVRCESAAWYSRMMEREYGYLQLRKKYGKNWVNHSFKMVNKEYRYGRISQMGKEESLRLAHALKSHNLLEKVEEIIRR